MQTFRRAGYHSSKTMAVSKASEFVVGETVADVEVDGLIGAALMLPLRSEDFITDEFPTWSDKGFDHVFGSMKSGAGVLVSAVDCYGQMAEDVAPDVLDIVFIDAVVLTSLYVFRWPLLLTLAPL